MLTKYSNSKITYFILYFLFFFCLIGSSYSQYLNPPKEYYLNIRIADSLMLIRKYNVASNYYRAAFVFFGGRGTPDDRYNSARAYGLSGNNDSLILTLQILVDRNKFWDYNKIENDSAFYAIKKSKQFGDVISKAKENKMKYAPNINLELSSKLEDVYYEDQKRVILKDWNEIEKIDKKNLCIVTHFLDQYGWMGSDVVGIKGNIALFLVIQHADAHIRRKYLPMIKNAVEKGNASPEHLALIEDRLSLEEYGYQIYGSQVIFDSSNNTYKLPPIVEEKEVNDRRKKIGMNSLQEYLEKFGIKYNPL